MPGPSNREHLMRLPEAQHTQQQHTTTISAGRSSRTTCTTQGRRLQTHTNHNVLFGNSKRSQRPARIAKMCQLPMPPNDALACWPPPSPPTCRAGLFIKHLVSNRRNPVVWHSSEVGAQQLLYLVLACECCVFTCLEAHGATRRSRGRGSEGQRMSASSLCVSDLVPKLKS